MKKDEKSNWSLDIFWAAIGCKTHRQPVKAAKVGPDSGSQMFGTCVHVMINRRFYLSWASSPKYLHIVLVRIYILYVVVCCAYSMRQWLLI